jgi:hypothetical protein
LNFQHPATNRATAISLCAASAPRGLEAFMNRDPRWALSQELEADALGVKQELEKALTQDGKPTK